MGKASRRHEERRKEREVERQKLRVVVCSYPESSLAPSVELLKAAILYGDEVLLHSPTATLLASLASMPSLTTQQLLGTLTELTPHLGRRGEEVSSQLKALDSQHGDGAGLGIAGALVDQSDAVRVLLEASDPLGAAQLSGFAEEFSAMREEMNGVIEQQLDAAGVGLVTPAIDAGILRLLPVDMSGDLFDGYLDALWGVLRDRHHYPLFDEQIADLVNSSVQEGLVDATPRSRQRGRQVSAASGFLARLPTFPLATIDEVIDIRDELAQPLKRFRSEMVKVATDLNVDAFDPTFDEAAEQAWREQVEPALADLHDLVEEKRLPQQFGKAVKASGAIGAAGGLITGVINHGPLAQAAVSIGSAVATGVTTILNNRADIERDIKQRPYFLLHRTEELLN
jgi:hypothetical protein